MSRTQVGATTKTADLPRASFDLSHNLKTTFNASELVPILSLEVLPGDTINLRASLFGRMATPIKPVLDNLYLETFFFFTPWRQVWPNFLKLMGEQEAPGDSIDYSVPRLAGSTAILSGTNADYMGVPIGTIPEQVVISALPFRCLAAVKNFWFRDENLVDPQVFATGDGPDTNATANFNNFPSKRRKRRDYITSALPFPQKGPDVTVSMGTSANVIATDDATPTFDVGGTGITNEAMQGAVSTGNVQFEGAPNGTADVRWNQTKLIADLTTATALSINELRESVQIQRLLERDARGGTRYPEILRSHFQVNDPGLLVHQRPLFLGGGQSQININPVTQQSPSDIGPELTPQGNLAGYGVVSGSNHGFTSSFTEHGHILGLVNVRADLTYQQGLERYWSRQTRYDFYWPVLSHLGEQDIKNKEVFVSNNPAIDDDTFGYIPRYDEYRFKQSQITGIFRSEADASLDVWHLAQDFQTLPALNASFIEDNVPMDRVVAVPTEPDFLLDVYFKIKAARPLPLYGTPGLMDHF